MENQELLLLDLEEFERSNQNDTEIPQNLENFIEFVSKTGTYIFPWAKIKKLYLKKMNQVIDLFNQTSQNNQEMQIPNFDSLLFNEIKNRLLERIKSFHNAPFTIQRISELLLKPHNNYTRIDKFLRGLEKCVMVVTTIDPSGNKIFTESPLVNGYSNDVNLNGSLCNSQHSYSQTQLNIETKLTNIVDLNVNIDCTTRRNTIILTKQSRIDLNEDTEAKFVNMSETRNNIVENDDEKDNNNNNDNNNNEDDDVVNNNNNNNNNHDNHDDNRDENQIEQHDKHNKFNNLLINVIAPTNEKELSNTIKEKANELVEDNNLQRSNENITNGHNDKIIIDANKDSDDKLLNENSIKNNSNNVYSSNQNDTNDDSMGVTNDDICTSNDNTNNIDYVKNSDCEKTVNTTTTQNELTKSECNNDMTNQTSSNYTDESMDS